METVVRCLVITKKEETVRSLPQTKPKKWQNFRLDCCTFSHSADPRSATAELHRIEAEIHPENSRSPHLFSRPVSRRPCAHRREQAERRHLLPCAWFFLRASIANEKDSVSLLPPWSLFYFRLGLSLRNRIYR